LQYYASYKAGVYDKTLELLQYQDAGCVAWAKFLIDVLEAQGIHETDWFYAVGPKLPNNQTPVNPWQIVVKQWTYAAAGTGLVTFPNIAFIDASIGNGMGGTKFFLNTFAKFTAGNGTPEIAADNHSYVWTSSQVVQKQDGETNIPGQGVKAPASLFYAHNLVKIGTAFYDPSYGKIWDDSKGDGLKKFRADALEGFAVRVPELPLDANKHFDPMGAKTPSIIFLPPRDNKEPIIGRLPDKDFDNY